MPEARVAVAHGQLRERELERLSSFLDEAINRKGQMAFVSGGPGQGKTALLREFTHRAMETHPDLLVASGNCNAYAGVGDPYLPFREIMAMLSGDVEALWASGAITQDHALRLWRSRSFGRCLPNCGTANQ